MADKGFVHINGITYETTDVWDQPSAERLVKALQHKPESAAARRHLELTGTSLTHRISVSMPDGVTAALVVETGSVWAAAAWTVPEVDNPRIY